MTTEDHNSLNAWIAEHVMGRRILSDEWMISQAIAVWKEQPKCRIFYSGFSAWPSEIPNEPIVKQDFPAYTTSPAAAMEVWKWCAQKESPQSIAFCYDAETWHCFVGGYWDERVTAPALELAICLFAKKLFGKEAL